MELADRSRPVGFVQEIEHIAIQNNVERTIRLPDVEGTPDEQFEIALSSPAQLFARPRQHSF